MSNPSQTPHKRVSHQNDKSAWRIKRARKRSHLKSMTTYFISSTSLFNCLCCLSLIISCRILPVRCPCKNPLFTLMYILIGLIICTSFVAYVAVVTRCRKKNCRYHHKGGFQANQRCEAFSSLQDKIGRKKHVNRVHHIGTDESH